MSMGVQPANGYCVVQLGALMQLKHIKTQVGKYDTHTDGTVVAVPSTDTEWLGRHVYFPEFKEGTKFSRDGVEYAFVKIDEIEGYDIETSA